ncbi:MAG: tetratricopeptide repeat protein [Candidatus Lokiarchaeota archaeon]|nr:tetratricopeptide repeat protein [Candidatus Lokiarchaeota archaeon]
MKDKKDYYLEGLICYSNRQWIDALSNFQKALEIDPMDYQVLKHLAMTYDALLDYKNSAIYFEKLHEMDPKDQDVLEYWAYALYFQDKFDLAAQKIEELNKIQPKPYLKSYKSIINHFTSLMKLHPDWWTRLNNEAWMLLIGGRIEDAKKISEFLINRGSQINDKEMEYVGKDLLASCLANSNDKKQLEKALKLFEEVKKVSIRILSTQVYQNTLRKLKIVQPKMSEEIAIKIDEGLSDGWQIIGTHLIKSGDFIEALAKLKNAIELNPTNASLWAEQGFAFECLEKDDEAMESYDKALTMDPNNFVALYGKGRLLASQNLNATALELFEKAVEIKPNVIPLLIEIANISGSLGRFADAVFWYEKALLINDELTDALANNAITSIQIGKPERALECISRAIKLEPDNAGYWDRKGLIHLELQEFEEALNALNKALELEPNNENSIFKKGWALSRLKNYPESIKCFEKAIELNTSNEMASKFLKVLEIKMQKLKSEPIGKPEGQIDKGLDEKLLYSGFYVFKNPKGYHELIRFYPNRVAITVGTADSIEDAIKWFQWNTVFKRITAGYYSIGHWDEPGYSSIANGYYKLTGNKISVTVKNKDNVLFEYTGMLKGKELFLNLFSYYNNSFNEKHYNFVDFNLEVEDISGRILEGPRKKEPIEEKESDINEADDFTETELEPAENSSALQFSGFYLREEQDNTYYLRFYEDGRVVTYSSYHYEGPEETNRTLNWDSKYDLDKDYYKTDGKKIIFSIKTSSGKLDYCCILKNKELIVKLYSHINKKRFEDNYKFVSLDFDDLKPSKSENIQVKVSVFGQGPKKAVSERDSIYIESTGLIKAIYFSLLHSNNYNNDDSDGFQMTMGLIAGKILEGDVFIHKTYCMEHGTSTSVKFGNDSYVKSAEINDKLYNEEMQVLGWFISILDEALLPTSENVTTQLGYQSMNPRAIGMQIKPERFWEKDLHESIKIFRLKDITAGTGSDWIELPFELIDKSEQNFLNLLKEDFELLNQTLDISALKNDELDKKLDEWITKFKPLDQVLTCEDCQNPISYLAITCPKCKFIRTSHYFDESPLINKDIARSLVKKGDMKRAQGSLDMAIRLYQAANYLGYNEPEIYHKRLESMRDYNIFDHKSYVILLKKIFNLNDPEYRKNIDLADTAYNEGNYENAIKFLKKASEIAPHYIDPVANIGMTYKILALNEEKKQNEEKGKKYRLESLEYFKRASELNPNNIKTLQEYGFALKDLELYDDAYLIFKRLNELEPNSSVWFALLGEVFHGMKRYDAALDNFNTYLSVNPEDDGILKDKAMTLTALKRYKDALKTIEKAIKIDSNSSIYWNIKGAILIEMESPKKAEKALKKALKLDPKNQKALKNLDLLKK